MWKDKMRIKAIKVIRFDSNSDFKVDLKRFGFTDFENIKSIPTLESMEFFIGNKGYDIKINHEGNGVFSCRLFSSAISSTSVYSWGKVTSVEIPSGCSRVMVSCSCSPLLEKGHINGYIDGKQLLNSSNLTGYTNNMSIFSECTYINQEKKPKTMSISWGVKDLSSTRHRTVVLFDYAEEKQDKTAVVNVIFIQGGV